VALTDKVQKKMAGPPAASGLKSPTTTLVARMLSAHAQHRSVTPALPAVSRYCGQRPRSAGVSVVVGVDPSHFTRLGRARRGGNLSENPSFSGSSRATA